MAGKWGQEDLIKTFSCPHLPANPVLFLSNEFRFPDHLAQDFVDKRLS